VWRLVGRRAEPVNAEATPMVATKRRERIFLVLYFEVREKTKD
jgi:hypothetical protein